MRIGMFLLGFAVLLAGCSGSTTRPDWVEGAEGAYPGVDYLIGRGEGGSAALARDRARADLAKVFGTRISEESIELASATRRTDGEQSELRAETTLQRALASTTDRTLEGVRIAESWYDPVGKQHYALAVLDRRQAAVRLRAEIRALDAATEAAIAASRSEDDPLRQLSHASESVEAQQRRAMHQRNLRLIDPTGAGLAPRWDLAGLERARAELAGRIHVAVSGEGSEADTVTRLLAGGVAAAGLRHAELPQADYLLSGALELDEFTAEGWEWARGTLRLEVFDREANLRNSARWPVKGAGRRPQTARERAIEEADRLLRQRLPSWLTGRREGDG